MQIGQIVVANQRDIAVIGGGFAQPRVNIGQKRWNVVGNWLAVIAGIIVGIVISIADQQHIAWRRCSPILVGIGEKCPNRLWINPPIAKLIVDPLHVDHLGAQTLSRASRHQWPQLVAPRG